MLHAKCVGDDFSHFYHQHQIRYISVGLPTSIICNQASRFLTSSVKIIIFDVLGEMSGYTVSLLLQVLFKLKHDGEWLMSDYDPMANFKFQHSTMSLIFVKRSANYDAIISR